MTLWKYFFSQWLQDIRWHFFYFEIFDFFNSLVTFPLTKLGLEINIKLAVSYNLWKSWSNEHHKITFLHNVTILLNLMTHFHLGQSYHNISLPTIPILLRCLSSTFSFFLYCLLVFHCMINIMGQIKKNCHGIDDLINLQHDASIRRILLGNNNQSDK